MADVYALSDNIISPLGFTTDENLVNLKRDVSGIRLLNDGKPYGNAIWASMMDQAKLNGQFTQIADGNKYTRLEKMFILSISDAAERAGLDLKDKDNQLIISTTKGNIDILDKSAVGDFPKDKINLWSIAWVIKEYFQLKCSPFVVSTACTSGASAIILGARLIKAGKCKNAIISGGDIISDFVISGFNSLHALGNGPCRPFDKNRSGLSLGEACGTIILSSYCNSIAGQRKIRFTGGATGNEAHHITAPSRDGLGLARVIRCALRQSAHEGIDDIDFISAHGTATIFNDESEALALNNCELNEKPVNSLKRYWGHTLGAAAVIETIAAITAIRDGFLINTKGFEELGVSVPLNIIKTTGRSDVNTILKTCSGFGAQNAALVFTGNK